MGLQEYGSAVYYPTNKTHEQLLDECGIHDCKNAFCGGEADEQDQNPAAADVAMRGMLTAPLVRP